MALEHSSAGSEHPDMQIGRVRGSLPA